MRSLPLDIGARSLSLLRSGKCFSYSQNFAKFSLEKCDFNQFKRIFHGKNGPNSPIFKMKKIKSNQI